MKIFWASQSGTAEGFAYDMAKESKNYGFKGEAIDLEDYDSETLNDEKLVIFLVATYGEGEPTDNSQQFYNWLSSNDRQENELNNIEFGVFGLGNSQYEFFNEMGKKFDYYFEKLGGLRLLERGVGDEDTGNTEDQFQEWKKLLWTLISRKYLNKDISNIDNKFESSIDIHYIYNHKQDQETKEDKEEEEEKEKEEQEEHIKVKEIKEKYGQNIDEMALLIKYPYYLPKDTQFNFIPHIFLPSRKHNWMDNVVLSSIIKKNGSKTSNKRWINITC